MIVPNENTDVVIYVEDPGAANYLFQLPSALIDRAIESCMIADGTAAKFLKERSIGFVPFHSDDSASRILNEYRPGLLIVGTSINPDSVGLDLIRHAKALNIPSIGAVDAFVGAKNRFRGRSDNALAYAPDWLFVPGERTKQAFVELGYPQDGIVVCGHPQYDNMRCIADRYKAIDAENLKQRLLPNVHEKQKVILFASVPKHPTEPIKLDSFSEYTLKGSGNRFSQSEIVIEAFLDAIGTLSPKPYLILRLHPRQTVEDVSGLEKKFDAISTGGPAFDLVHVSDMVAGLPTMLLVEAALLGKPTLAIVAKPPTEVLLPTIATGHTLCVHDKKALQKAISHLVGENDKPPDVVHGIDDLVYGALEKIGRFIEALLKEEKQ